MWQALEAAVKLSHRYIQDRFLPDKVCVCVCVACVCVQVCPADKGALPATPTTPSAPATARPSFAPSKH